MQMQLPAMPPVVVRWITAEPRFYEHWEFWLSVLTLLLVVATFLLVLETRRMRTTGSPAGMRVVPPQSVGERFQALVAYID
jgi:hypothetical protein